MFHRTTKFSVLRLLKVSERRLSYHPHNVLNELGALCTEHLRGLVLVKCSVNKKNIEINVEKYCTNTKRSSKDQWDSVAKQLASAIQERCAIVNVNFKTDVEKIVQSLKEGGNRRL